MNDKTITDAAIVSETPKVNNGDLAKVTDFAAPARAAAVARSAVPAPGAGTPAPGMAWRCRARSAAWCGRPPPGAGRPSRGRRRSWRG